MARTASNSVRTNGPAVREIRKARGLSQTEFAKRIDRDRAYVAHIEKGDRNPSPDTFESIISVLRIEDRTAIMSEAS